MTKLDSTTVLAAARSSIGVSGWLAPIAAGRLFGIEASKDVSAPQYLRMGATRDFALAAGPFVTTGRSRKAVLALAGACDVGDIIGVAIASRRGRISRGSRRLRRRIAELSCAQYQGSWRGRQLSACTAKPGAVDAERRRRISAASGT